jgi:dimethylhistidine N-methyltransferase
LFERITKLPEYYLSRVEQTILASHGAELAQLAGRGRVVMEFGSGSSTKTPLLLSAISPAAYVPIDISGDFLRESVKRLKRSFPFLPMHPVEGDFTQPLFLPELHDLHNAPRLGFFPGSTIGNLAPRDAVDLLRAFAAALGPDAQLLIGIDRIKSPAVVVPAYDDAEGVTAAFNLNLLRRINRELEGTIPLARFRHVVRWNDSESRIEMHLEATRDMAFRVSGVEFDMSAGETIHTENCVKYGERDARVLLRAGGWSPLAEWVDRERYFAVILAVAAARATAH